jgi:hypothetical protein
MTASEIEPIELPRYVAFLAWRTVPVIARIESCRGGRLWGHWFSRITPKGAFKKVPLGGVVLVQSNREAEELIALIRAGKDLPQDFVTKLRVGEQDPVD